MTSLRILLLVGLLAAWQLPPAQLQETSAGSNGGSNSSSSSITATTTTTTPAGNSDPSPSAATLATTPPDTTGPEAATARETAETITSVAPETIGEDERPTSVISSDSGGEPAEADEPTLAGLEAKSISHQADGNEPTKEEREKTNDKLTAEAPSEPDDSEGAGAEREPAAASQSSHHEAVSKLARRPMPSRLNLTQIDETYTLGRKEESETVEAWKRMGKKLKKGISGAIGSLVPFALNMSQEARINSNCSGAMLKWVLSMNQLKAWALRMLDASGKPIAGLLEGSMTMFGNYRQCLKIRAPDDDEIEFAGEFREYFRGKYCIIQAKPWLPPKDRFYNLNAKLRSLSGEAAAGGEEENAAYDRTIFEELSEWLLAFNFVNIRYDLCVPSLCSREDIQKAVNFLTQGLDLKARVVRCETDLPNGKFGFGAQIESGAPELSGAFAASTSSDVPADRSLAHAELGAFSRQLGWIIIPLVALALVLAASLLSLIMGEDEDEDDAEGHPKKNNKLKRAVKSLSLKRSVRSHLKIDYDQLADDKPLALYGVRFLLVLWVILVESAVNLKFEYLRELMMLKDLIFWWPMQFIINSTMQYDSFILLTAFTMGYKNCLNDGIHNGKAITRFVVDKYVRLMPSIMVMVAMVILLPLVYRGPVWNDYVAKQSAVCQSTGWLNTIFLQNYLPYGDICLPQTWLLCIELQLVFIMAPIVYYLNKSYTSNFGGNSRANIMLNGGEKKNPELGGTPLAVSSTSRRNDSSRPLHWLWTAPGAFLSACIALGLASSFYNVYYKELPPSWFYTMADPDSKALYFGEHMTKLWTHLAVFAMGILAGVECRRATKNVHRGYRSSNINFMSHTNGLSSQHNHTRSHSSSASSLPMILAQNGNASLMNATKSRLATSSEGWHQQNGSCVSININHQSYQGQDEALTPSSTGGSDVGCLQSASSEAHTSRHGRGGCRSTLLDLLGFMIAITIMSAIIFSTHDWALNDLPRPLIAGLFDAGSRFFWSLAMIWILYRASVPREDRSFSLPARALGHPAMVCLGKLSFLIYIIHPFVHTTVLAIQEQPIYSSWLMMFHILIGNITITVILASLVSLFVEMPCRNLFRRCGTSLLLTQSIRSGDNRGRGGDRDGSASSATGL